MPLMQSLISKFSRGVLLLVLELGMLFSSVLRGEEIELLTHEPSQAAAGLDSTSGLDCALFAAEPMVINPAAIDVDHRGRVWACEIVNYRKRAGSRPAGDRIIILEDNNGDGQADTSKVFYQGIDIDSPHGVCVLGTPDGRGTRAIVSTGSRVVLLIDEDGDDQCDRQEDLFTGIQGSQNDHGIHAVVLGPDGRLYFNFGNAGEEIRNASGEFIVDRAGNTVENKREPYQEGMAFRCNLDGSAFETLAWNFRNPWMLTVDSFGNIWQSDNDDDGNRACRVNFIMEYGNYGYRDELTGASWQTRRTGQAAELPERHWHVNDPGVVPTMLYTGSGAPAGLTDYEGKLLSRVVPGQLVHCEPGHNSLRSYLIQEKGGGYSAEISDIVQGARDAWFRPVDVKVAPDGSLFVADWYDPGVGAHEVADLQRGRVFRLAPTGGGNHYEVPKFDFTNPAGAVVALKNPNSAVRGVAWQEMLKWGKQAVPELQKLWESGDPLLQARAIWLLGAVAKDSSRSIDEALSSTDARLRVVGLRLARQHQRDMVPLVKRLVHDPSPQVQRELAIALANDDRKEAAQTWAELASYYRGNDRWLLEALGIGARGKWDACLADWLRIVGDQWCEKAGADIVWRSRSEATPELLAKLILEKVEEGGNVERYLRAFDFQAEPGKSLALMRLVQECQILPPDVVVEILDRLPEVDVKETPKLMESLDAYLSSHQGSEFYFQFIRRFQLTDYIDDLLAQIISAKNDHGSVEAARTILDLVGVQRLIEVVPILADEEAPALVTFGLLDAPRLNQVLSDLVQDDSARLALRIEAARGLTKTSGGQHLLIQAARQGKLPARSQFMVADALHLSPDQEIRQQIALLLPLPQSADAESLPPVGQLLQEVGNVENGKQVFAEVGTCIQCHRVRGEGKQVGPDLSEIGSKLSREAMYQAILDPSAGINHNYEQYIVVLETGKSLSGLLMNKTDEVVTLRNAEGIDKTILREKIEEAKPERSLSDACRYSTEAHETTTR